MTEHFTKHSAEITWKTSKADKRVYENERGVRGTARGHEKWNTAEFRQIFLDIPGACETVQSSLDVEYVRHLIMMNRCSDCTDLSGAVALKFGSDGVKVAGCVLWTKFVPEMNARNSNNPSSAAYNESSRQPIVFADKDIREDMNNNAVAHLSTVCTCESMHRMGIGTLMTWYGMYDIQRRMRLGQRKYGTILFRHHNKKTNYESYTDYRRSMRTSMPALLYQRLGFKEAKERPKKRSKEEKRGSVVGLIHPHAAWDRYYMSYRPDGRNVYNMSHQIEESFQMETLKSVCQAPGVCL